MKTAISVRRFRDDVPLTSMRTVYDATTRGGKRRLQPTAVHGKERAGKPTRSFRDDYRATRRQRITTNLPILREKLSDSLSTE
jgi:hypothetical protein